MLSWIFLRICNNNLANKIAKSISWGDGMQQQQFIFDGKELEFENKIVVWDENLVLLNESCLCDLCNKVIKKNSWCYHGIFVKYGIDAFCCLLCEREDIELIS